MNDKALTNKCCEHTKVFVTDTAGLRTQVPCPWCKDARIRELERELAFARERIAIEEQAYEGAMKLVTQVADKRATTEPEVSVAMLADKGRVVTHPAYPPDDERRYAAHEPGSTQAPEVPQPGWTTESVLKRHGLWAEHWIDKGATAIRLRWLEMQIEKLQEAARSTAEPAPNEKSVVAHGIKGSDGTMQVCLGENEALFKALDLSKRFPSVLFSIVPLVEQSQPEPRAQHDPVFDKIDEELRDADTVVKLAACGDVDSFVKASVLISRARERVFSLRRPTQERG